MSYHSSLLERINATACLCVGLDPHPAILGAWGASDDVAGLERVALGTVEALGGVVAAFKPQSAFFEQYGSAGIAVLEKCLSAIRDTGATSILDVKRGDIGSTMTAYAKAYLGEGPLRADAITVSPYLGFGALEPAMALAEANGRGVFVLARTSNPEGTDIQLGSTVGGAKVAQSVIDQAAARNRTTGKNAVGLVVGGTYEDLQVDLSAYEGTILVPGVGAQGGTVSQVRSAFANTPAVVLPTASREILQAGPDAKALRSAAAKVLRS